MSLILSTTAGKSHLIHLIDTPGHINFVDEAASAMRLVDGIVLVVDVVEGVSPIAVMPVSGNDLNYFSLWSVLSTSFDMPFKKVSKSLLS